MKTPLFGDDEPVEPDLAGIATVRLEDGWSR
jgi:hypothetical protein